MEILYGLPASAKLIVGAKYGDSRAGLEVSDFVTGATLTRNWSDMNRRIYDLKLLLENYVGGADEWAAFLRQTVMGSKPFIVTEPVRHAHTDLPVYPLPDGVITTFNVPMVFNDELVIFVDGVPVDFIAVPAGYDVPLNALSHEQATASPLDGTSDLTGIWESTLGGAAFFAIGGAGLAGPRGVLIENVTPAPDVGVTTPARVDLGAMASAGAPTKAGCWVRGDGTFEASLQLWAPGGALVADVTAGTVCTIDEWTFVEVQAPTPGGTPAEAMLTIKRPASAAGIVLMDCFFISPLGAEFWVDPSNSLTPVEILPAPPVGAKVTAGGHGRRSSLVTAAKTSASWQPLATGRAVPDGLRVVEELPGVKGATT